MDNVRDKDRSAADDVAVAKNLGTAAPAAAPPAVRASRPGWRDPRLWIGVALVAVCVVAGARIIGSADDTVEVWAAAAEQSPGETLTADDLVAERVRFADDGDLADYYAVDDTLPDQLTLLRGVGAGELLPRSAVGKPGSSGLLQLPLSVDAGQVPPSVREGSVVDVYVGGTGADQEDGPVLGKVSVVSVVLPEDSLSGTGQEQLTVATDERDARAYFALAGSIDDPVLTVVRRS